ncbi:MAG: bifunctional metallophosphatase/5'-nucleotidase [Phascolarctobacterium sp.]|nr:bifunctional metallophosphatase/5'-nucleotidase [Phascolarctobacterium sp.]
MQTKFLGFGKIALATALLFSQSLSAWALENPIYIYHTNDVHCGVNDNIGFAKVAALKQQALKITPHVVLVDAGDAIQGAPIGKFTDGQAVVKIMNAVGYDVLVPGNHEFDYGMDKFLAVNANSNSGYFCANLMDLRTGKQVLPGYKLMTFEDTKVAFVGATTPEASVTSTPKFFQDEEGKWIYGFCDDSKGKKLYRQLQQNINAARKEGAKYVFLVAHLGDNGVKKEWSSPQVAKKLKHLTAVIDGHSHETFTRFELGKASRVVAQTGTKLQNIGLVIIRPDGSLETRMDNYRVVNVTPDEAVGRLVNSEVNKIATVLAEKLGESKFRLCADDPQTGKRIIRTQSCNLGDLIADSFRFATGADVAVVGGGGLRKDINAGPITHNTFMQTIPFGNMVTSKKVSGQKLLDSLEMGARKLPNENGGFMHISGGSYTIDTAVPSSVEVDSKGAFIRVNGPYRVKDVIINGQPLDLKREYVVCSTNYALKYGGDGMTMFNDCKVVQDETYSDFDAFSLYLKEKLGGIIGQEYANPYGQGRIKIK